MLFNLIKLPPSAHFVRIHLPLGGRLFGTATSKAPSLRGLSPSGDWGSYPKYSCISAFFNSSSFSRLCCMVCFCWSTRSTKAANIRWFSNSGMRTLICFSFVTLIPAIIAPELTISIWRLTASLK